MKPNNPIDFRGIDHVVLRVSDVERSLHFYTEVLGLALERVVEDIGVHQIRCGQHLIDLCGVKEGKQLAEKDERGIDHLCLLVHGDFDAIVDYLKSRDVQVTGPMELYGATGFGTSIYVLDPDDHTIEIKADYAQYPMRTSAAEAFGGMTRPSRQ